MSLGTTPRPNGGPCTLQGVRIYTGRPDSRKVPKRHAAHMKQSIEWAASGAQVITRPLRYPRGWPTDPAQEKGVDVALAIDFVTMAVSHAYDVGVIMSVDSDLRPALEFVNSQPSQHQHVAVAAWRSSSNSQRLTVPGAAIPCHWLNKTDYDAVADLTNYVR